MRISRREDVSLYFYIRDCVINPVFSEITEEQTLVQTSTNEWEIQYDENLGKYPFRRFDSDGVLVHTGRGRGIPYFDFDGDCCVFGTEQTNNVSIYSGSTTVSGYTVDYLGGKIITSMDLTGYSIDYYWNYVAVLDAWPDEDVPALPVVSITMQEGDTRPLQLGYGDIRGGLWNIEIFAENKGQRDDLLDVIYGGIHKRRCPIYTFDDGLPLRYDGKYNTNFTTTYDSSYRHLIFNNVTRKYSSLPKWGFYREETVNKYRGQITFQTEAFLL